VSNDAGTQQLSVQEIVMSEFIVHSVPGSPFGRAVMAVLEEKGASYRFAPVAPGTFRSPEHLARHPFGRVPVLEHDGFTLYESQAILRYLDRVLPVPVLTPVEPKRIARMDQVMNVNDWYLFQGVGNVIGYHRVIAPRLLGLAPDESGHRGRDAEGARRLRRIGANARRAKLFCW
jgi:glutathione S-transferase